MTFTQSVPLPNFLEAPTGARGREPQATPIKAREVLFVVNRIRLARGLPLLHSLPYEGERCEPDACIVACWTGLKISERELMFEGMDEAQSIAGALGAEGLIGELAPVKNEEDGGWVVPLPDCLRQVVDCFDFGELRLADLGVDRAESVRGIDRWAA